MPSPYTRKGTSASRAVIHADVDRPNRWKKHLSKTQLAQFTDIRLAVWKRLPAYLPALANAIAAAERTGVAIFPSHYDFAGHSFELRMPRVLAAATPRQRKSSAFIQGVLANMIADGQMDRIATLVIGLASAGKVPHWAMFAAVDEGLPDTWSETEVEEEAEEEAEEEPWIDYDATPEAEPYPLTAEAAAMWADFVASRDRRNREKATVAPAAEKRKKTRPQPAPKQRRGQLRRAASPVRRSTSPRWAATTHTSDVDATLFDALNWRRTV